MKVEATYEETFARFRNILKDTFDDCVVDAFVHEALDAWASQVTDGLTPHYEIRGRYTKTGYPTVETP